MLSFLIIFGLSFLLGLMPLALNSHAVPISSVPDPRLNNIWVSDTVDLLSSDTEDQLNQLFSYLDTENGEEIVVVTVLDTQTFLHPGDFASKLNLTWELGKKDLNNGIVILISKKENTTSIDMGGIRRLFTSNQYDELLTSLDKPLDQENFETNLVTVSQAIINKLGNPPVDLPNTFEQPLSTDAKDQNSADGILIVFAVVGILVLSAFIGLLSTMIWPFLYLSGVAFIFVCKKAYSLIKNKPLKKY